MTFAPEAWIASIISRTMSSPVKISTSIISALPVAATALLSSAYFSVDIGCTPPSLSVRKVQRRGVSPITSRSSLTSSETFAISSTSSYQSIRHSIRSICMPRYVRVRERMSSFVFPTLGMQIAGIPFPSSRFLTFTVFIEKFSLIFINVGNSQFFFHVFTVHTLAEDQFDSCNCLMPCPFIVLHPACLAIFNIAVSCGA